MKKIFTLLTFFTICTVVVTAQNYATGRRVINFVDAARANRQVLTELYYPADVAGNDVPLAAGIEKFPVVAFGHGFVIPVSAYIWLADSLVKNGYIVALPTTESDLSPDHNAFGNDLAFLCNRLLTLNDSVASFLYQRIINKAAVAGHSMGGGCSFLAASGNARISAIFNFAAAETNPSAIAAALLVNQPALIFSGTGDCIVPAATQQQMFTNVIASCKTYINITGALHCQFANNNGTCSLGQVLSGCNSSPITPQIVFNKTAALIIPFLDYYLKGICSRGNDYTDTYDALTGVEKTRNCTTLPGCSALPVTLENFNGRLINNIINLRWKAIVENDLEYFIVEKSADGMAFQSFKQVAPISNTTSAEYAVVDNYPYPSYSYYRLKMINKDRRISASSIIKITTPKKNLALIKFFPNPVKSNIQVELVSGKIQKVILNVYNATGQRVGLESITLNAGLNKKSILLDKLPDGIYNLLFKDEQGIAIGSNKIIKK